MLLPGPPPDSFKLYFTMLLVINKFFNLCLKLYNWENFTNDQGKLLVPFRTMWKMDGISKTMNERRREDLLQLSQYEFCLPTMPSYEVRLTNGGSTGKNQFLCNYLVTRKMTIKLPKNRIRLQCSFENAERIYGSDDIIYLRFAIFCRDESNKPLTKKAISPKMD